MSKKEILKRMNYLIGHLNGVKRMIAEDKYCIDIITQNIGVIGALHEVNHSVLNKHFNSCLIEAIRGRSVKERAKKINELLKIFASLK